MENRKINRIVTLTPNPCFDTVLELEAAEDDLYRSVAERTESAGKGLHVACVAARLGAEAEAFVLAGRDNFENYRAGIPAGDYRVEFVLNPGRIRENATLRMPEKSVKVNRSGFKADPAAVRELTEKLVARLGPGAILAVSGSFPRHFGFEELRVIAEAARDRGVPLVLDTAALNSAQLAELQPFLIKPNEFEVKELTGIVPETPEDTARALRVLHEAGIENVLLSLGARGLLFSDGRSVIRAKVPEVPVQSTIGAGDSSLAGLLYGLVAGLPPAECVRMAAACGTATAMLPGTELTGRAEAEALLPRIEIE